MTSAPTMAIISKFFLFLALSSPFDLCSAVKDVDGEPIARVLSENPQKQLRIVNGERSTPSDAPFFARAGYDEYFFTNEIVCGATLISSDILVTAAHCQGAFNHGVQILGTDRNDFDRLVPIDRQVRHPKWALSRTQLNYDVLVMRLKTPLSSTDVAQPISINNANNYPSEGDSLRAYGFGLTEDNKVSNYLREAQVTYISNDKCWGRGITFNNVMKSDEVMCTDPHNDQTATCLGDSGGPLTDSKRNYLVGIISFGSGCKPDHIPDGHVRISEVHDWIQDQICLLSRDPPASCSNVVEEPDPLAVEVVIDFTHDFYPEHTTFAVRSKETRRNVYSGPEYIPTRSGNHRESLFLLPGEYTFDIYDSAGNGLDSERGQGSWKVLALYDGSTETELANGGHLFGNQQVTTFVVAQGTAPVNDNDADDTELSNNGSLDIVPDQLRDCLQSRDVQLSSPDMSLTTCTCEPGQSNEYVLKCFHSASMEPCGYKWQSCKSNDDCCGERTCSWEGQCRSRSTVSLGRERNRLGGTTVGGAAARTARGAGARTAHGPGNLRRR